MLTGSSRKVAAGKSAKSTLENRPPDWIAAPEVQAIGISRKVAGGRRRGDLALTVYVVEKRAAQNVSAPVPTHVKVRGVAREIPTDVVAIGQLALQATPLRPALPGCGIGLNGEASGTLGCIVKRKGDSDSLYLLSNAHVLANRQPNVGAIVLQPGADAGGVEPDCIIGSLYDWINITYSRDGFPNLVDAAIARVSDPSAVREYITLLGQPLGISDRIERGMAVRKSGFATGLTHGVVRDVNCSASLQFPTASRTERAGFRGLVVCDRFTSGGDSGAVVMNGSRQILGLHIGGSDTISIFCRISYVFSLLKLRLPDA
jgi:hypothetical protein